MSYRKVLSLLKAWLKAAVTLRRRGVVGVLLAVSGVALPVAAETLNVGFFELPPHAYLSPAGAPSGSAVAYFTAVAQKMGITDVQFKQMPLPRLLAELEQGRLDVAILLGKNPEREARFFYPSKPYYLAQPGLAVRSDFALREVKNPADLLPFKIAVRQAGLMSPSMQTPGLKLETVSGDSTDERNLRKMLDGRVDAVYSAEVGLLELLGKGMGAEQKMRLLVLPDTPTPIYSIFNKQTGPVLAPRYVRALDALTKEKGDYLSAFFK